jgi:hypothetical protein
MEVDRVRDEVWVRDGVGDLLLVFDGVHDDESETESVLVREPVLLFVMDGVIVCVGERDSEMEPVPDILSVDVEVIVREGDRYSDTLGDGDRVVLNDALGDFDKELDLEDDVLDVGVLVSDRDPVCVREFVADSETVLEQFS